MAFRGWTDEALAFYEGLEADNSKAYWQANKHVYEEAVRTPMEDLLAELAPKWGDGRLFRPYRDVRFSADKTPYKTHIGAVLGMCYVQFSADGLAAGCGMWEMASDQLARYREAVADGRSGPKLARAVGKLAPLGIEVMAHDMLKTAPRGYPKDHPRIELLHNPDRIIPRSLNLATVAARSPRIEPMKKARAVVMKAMPTVFRAP